MPAFTNAKQNIPQLFKEIMRNDSGREAILSQKALRWNTDKGKQQ